MIFLFSFVSPSTLVSTSLLEGKTSTQKDCLICSTYVGTDNIVILMHDTASTPINTVLYYNCIVHTSHER